MALDCDCFYAQCETRRDPSLAGKPVGVRQKHLVITSNYAARAYGIKKGDSLAEVRRKCPHIVIKDGEDISHYTEVSNAWRAFVANFVGSRCPVEKSGLDELFVDVTAAVDAHGAGGAGEIGHVHGDDELKERLASAARLCDRLRRATKRELNLETSAGVSTSKLLAKTVAGLHKPFQQTVLADTPNNRRLVLPDDLPLRKVYGIGHSTAQQLASAGVATVGDLRGFSGPSSISDIERLRALARGDDASLVKQTGAPKSIGAEESFWTKPLPVPSERADDALKMLARKLVRKIAVDQKANFEVPADLTLIKKVGSGAYGCVASFLDKKSNKKLAQRGAEEIRAHQEANGQASHCADDSAPLRRFRYAATAHPLQATVKMTIAVEGTT